MRFSASMIKKHMECPLQAKLHKEHQREEPLHGKTLFGTIIHDALEYYNLSGDVEEAKARFLYYWDNPEEVAKEPDTWGRGSGFGSLRKRGVEILDQYHEKNLWESREIIATEHYFLVPLGEHWLSGYVDLLEVKQSNRGKEVLRVVDYKTTSRQPYANELALDIQFTCYCYASLQPEFWYGVEHEEYGTVEGFENADELYGRFADMERRAIWYHLWGNKELDAGKRDDMDFLRLYRAMEMIAKAWDADIFIPNISGSSCNFCSYTDLCTAVSPVADRIEILENDDFDEGAF